MWDFSEQSSVCGKVWKYDIKRQYDLPIILSVSSEINVPRLPSIEGLLKATKKKCLYGIIVI